MRNGNKRLRDYYPQYLLISHITPSYLFSCNGFPHVYTREGPQFFMFFSNQPQPGIHDTGGFSLLSPFVNPHRIHTVPWLRMCLSFTDVFTSPMDYISKCVMPTSS